MTLTTNLDTRASCVYCDEQLNHDIVYVTPELPLIQGCTQSPGGYLAKQKWVQCRCCGTVQLAELVALDLLYSSGHAESFGTLWENHHTKFAEFISIDKPKDIHEIGGGVGKLYSAYSCKNLCNRWFNYEVSNTPQSISDHTYVYTTNIVNYNGMEEKDVIVLSHCLEHFYKPRDFLEEVCGSKVQNIYISWPNLEAYVKNYMPGALNWEHTYYITDEMLITLFESYGYILERKSHFSEHSIFYNFKKSYRYKKPVFTYSKNNNKELGTDVSKYFCKLKKISKNLKFNIQNNSGSQTFYLMPASVYLQTLLFFAEGQACISGIADNSQNKQGKYLYGTEYKVVSPKEVPKGSTVFVNSPMHFPEIRSQLEALSKDLQIHQVNNV